MSRIINYYADYNVLCSVDGCQGQNYLASFSKMQFLTLNVCCFFIALSDGHAEKSLKLAKATLKEVQETNPSSVNNREEIISNLHSCIGNALLDLDKPQQAMKHHLEDLSISEKK